VRWTHAGGALLGLLATLVSGVARAQEPAQAKPAPLASGEERALPDYDGRGEPPTTAGDVALWVPRIALFPAYVVTEYGVRKPLGFVVTAAERGRWIQELTEIFTFGPENNVGVVPTALIDFGFRTSVGVYFFYDDFLARENDLRLHAGFGGEDWLRLTLADRVHLDDETSVKFRGEAWKRPDGAFYGLGPLSSDDTASRYGANLFDGSIGFEGLVTPRVYLDVSAGVHHEDYFDATCCDVPSLDTRIDARQLPTPPGYEDGYTANRFALDVAYDTRRKRPAPGSGVRLEARSEHAFDMANPSDSRWVHWGAGLGGFVDLADSGRVLGLNVRTDFVDPLGDREVPFAEQAQLGGDSALRGFRPGRLIGRSSAVATLEYRYPVWAFLDGALDVGVGNVFGEHLEDLAPGRLRMSFTAGIRTANAHRDHSFDFLVGAGTSPFEEGAELSELRLVFGAKRGF
jgi:hypothetical protein